MFKNLYHGERRLCGNGACPAKSSEANRTGGIGGIMASVTVDGKEYNSGASWRCWQPSGHSNSIVHTGVGMGLWTNVDEPPTDWEKATFDDNAWPAAVAIAVLGSGPWGGGHNANFPPTAEWMWTEESNAHNDIFCRIVIPCGDELLYSQDFESIANIIELRKT